MHSYNIYKYCIKLFAWPHFCWLLLLWLSVVFCAMAMCVCLCLGVRKVMFICFIFWFIVSYKLLLMADGWISSAAPSLLLHRCHRCMPYIYIYNRPYCTNIAKALLMHASVSGITKYGCLGFRLPGTLVDSESEANIVNV